MDKTTIRFTTGIVGYTAPYATPEARPFDYQPGDVASIDSERARPWLDRGIAERVETAMREPRTERAMRVVGRRRRG